MAPNLKFTSKITTIERHILEEQQYHPEATGELTYLLYDIALAGKIIASHTNRAGLAEIIGQADSEVNIQGEVVQKLDVYADQTMYRLNDHTGRLAVMASEEHEDILPIPDEFPKGKYVLLYDPLDGSSNIDYNVSIGTIFAVYRRKSEQGPGTLEDCLQPGKDIVAAGYLLYGASTMLVYSAGHGVHGFTLDPSVGEFLLSHPYIQIPEKPRYYSVNQGYERKWSPGVQRYVKHLQGLDGEWGGLPARYVGSLVADFHRNLLAGGVYFYPGEIAEGGKPKGKLRLLYEANPLAFLAHHAGGYASDGTCSILDIKPEKLHQRVPLFIGNRALVEKAEEYIRKYDGI
ncbi:MAG: class 1 fructose-bisphosphatase [Anaerolineales bacterium]